MKYIGFKNFRKFENFPNLNLAPITMLVGGNNAGKSSVVKGILALSDFFSYRNDMLEVDMFMRVGHVNDIKKMKLEALKGIKFFFNTSYLAHIGTFKRALYNRANENVITFKTDIGQCDFEIEVIGNKNDEELVYGIVSKVRLNITDFSISVEIDLGQDRANVVFHSKSVKAISDNNRRRDIESIKKYFSSFDKDISISTGISDYWMPGRPDLIGSLLEAIETGIDISLFPCQEDRDIRSRFIKDLPIIDIDEDTKSFLKMYCNTFSSSFMGPRRYMTNNGFRLPYSRGPLYRMANIEYLYAHAVTQTVIYSAKDSNDYLSKTIHEFAPLQSHRNRREFVVKWMKEFGIGQGFTIKSVGGEAHLVWIINNDGEKVNLADKGMGSIQLMVLLFRLAVMLPQNRRMLPMERVGEIIIIEEPEQNLHPRLQSKLADLFYELNKNYGFHFLIETHSEYLIRRSQVIVANENYENEDELKNNNPFMVYYFDESNNREPYFPMTYELSGAFKEKFGSGFFDEASKWDMTIIRKEFELKKKNRK